MTHVTCRLTAKNRDQLQNPTLDSRVWTTFFTATTTMNSPKAGVVGVEGVEPVVDVSPAPRTRPMLLLLLLPLLVVMLVLMALAMAVVVVPALVAHQASLGGREADLSSVTRRCRRRRRRRPGLCQRSRRHRL